jgi:hypothetical protein
MVRFARPRQCISIAASTPILFISWQEKYKAAVATPSTRRHHRAVSSRSVRSYQGRSPRPWLAAGSLQKFKVSRCHCVVGLVTHAPSSSSGSGPGCVGDG